MPPVYTVSQIVAQMKDCLEGRFPSVDIEAEISNWRAYPSGHCYFALKDANAQLSAVLFARIPCDCRKELGDGRRVKVRGRISVYPQRGECQFVVMRIRLAGEGELMAKYLALKAKLEAEGLFRRKRPLPPYPRRIGIVTSPAGAVIHDMCGVLTRRFPNLEIRLYPAQVQGADAPRSLIAGIEYFSRQAGAADDGAWRADVVIIARGGGSFEDLFCFNDEELVRTIARCPVPVISAVGHETDYTLCDFVADFRAGTPSIAAEVAVPVLADVKRRLADAAAAMETRLKERADAAAQHLDRLSGALGAAVRYRAAAADAHLEAARRALGAALRAAVPGAEMRIAHLSKRMGNALAVAVERASSRLENDRSRLELLSPYSVLSRGYSLTLDEAGAVVRDAAALKPGDALTTRLASGTVRSIVEAR